MVDHVVPFKISSDIVTASIKMQLLSTGILVGGTKKQAWS